MSDREKEDRTEDRSAEKGQKTAGQEVGPPEERVDDEAGSDDAKTTKRRMSG